MSTALFAFLQLDLAGSMGIDDGRYLVREGARARRAPSGETNGGSPSGGDHPPVAVLVVETRDRHIPARRRRLRRERPTPAEHDASPAPVPMTRFTVVRSEQLDGEDEAAGWLEATAGDEANRDAFTAAGVAIVNRALHVQRTAAQDASLPDDPTAGALAIRIGYGAGNELIGGGWIDARELPLPTPRRRRVDSLRPQERLAAVLGGRDPVDACELLLLRARADLDAGRLREAALQLQVGLEALLVEIAEVPEQAQDLLELRARPAEIAAASDEALHGDLRGATTARLDDTLNLCERVVRRRRILGS